MGETDGESSRLDFRGYNSEDCKNVKVQWTVMQTDDWIEFKIFCKMTKCPAVIVADFETILEKLASKHQQVKQLLAKLG